jgi:uncharacterized protein HemX
MSESPYEHERDGDGGLLTLIVIILLLLGLAGGGVWVFQQRRQATMQAEVQALEAARAAEDARQKAIEAAKTTAAQEKAKSP